MAKYVELSADNAEELCRVAKALSSETRIEIIKLLYTYSLNVNEISEKLQIPASSAAMHIRVLEEAGLINTKQCPGERGAMKLCSRRSDLVTIRLSDIAAHAAEIATVSMPVGAFTDCHVLPTCGIGNSEGIIGSDDRTIGFYLPERLSAQLLWSAAGYVEYRFPDVTPPGKTAAQLSFSMEICSEAPNYREDWKSDITLWINGLSCGTWTSPGDFGHRRGRLNPSWITDGNSQYGLLTTWMINSNGCFVNEQKVLDRSIAELNLHKDPYLTVRIGNDPDASYVGGFNLFGEKCGDYAQNIIMSVEY